MKKLIYGISGLLFISVSCIYLFIPAEILISQIEQVESSERIISQYVNSSAGRTRWWTGTPKPDSSFRANGLQYDFIGAGYNSSKVLITGKKFKSLSMITWTPYANNIIEIRWQTSLVTSHNPAKRLLQYLEARRIKSNMASIMERLLSFIVSPKNVYNLSIERQTVKDTIMATSMFQSVTYPANVQIYRLVDSVKTYIESQNARQVSPPMLNISLDEEGSYRTMIGLPITKEIKPNRDVLINRMVRGNILVAEVKGGPGAIKNAFDQMEVYMNDFNLSSPAIPFESLITDRRAEQDTSQWITKIYYPVY